MHVNWSLVRIVLFIWVLIDSFNLGRSSIEFNGTGTAWSMLILGVVTLVCALIGLAVADLFARQAQAKLTRSVERQSLRRRGH
jgi:hypothetical protein